MNSSEGRAQRGFTLLETMAAFATLGVAVYAFVQVMNLRAAYQSRTNFSSKLSELVIENINEAKTRTMYGFLKPGDCLRRIYNLQGEFEQANKYDTDSQYCGKVKLNKNTAHPIVEVIWKVLGPDSIQATFDPPVFLKLPKDNTFMRIDIVGRVLAEPGPSEVHLAGVIFRH